MNELTPSPISYPVHVSRLPKSGTTVVIDADEEQRAALAALHGLVEVNKLVAKLDVSAWKKGGVKVSGYVSAELVQSCIVTLEPVPETLEEKISAVFLPEGSRLSVPQRSAEGEILLDPTGDDAPELFSGDIVDVGVLAEEFFTLGINPYPRAEGASVQAGDEETEEKRGPLYEKLQALRQKS